MKRVYITMGLTCAVILAILAGWLHYLNLSGVRDTLTVGFIYDNDESTPYTYNFSLAKDALERRYGDRVTILTCSNVLDDKMEDPLRDLVTKGCNVIFFNGYSELVVKLAPEYPEVEFCQTSYMDMTDKQVPPNYHTFKGEAYQARYVSGIAAGMKIDQMISEGVIKSDEAVVGFVAAFPLGVRSVVPQAVMRVRYTETWSSYAQEKSAAQALIDEGCVVISQHTDTIGPAVACEETEGERTVYHVGYNQSMSEVAPGTSLVASRICWEPYVTEAVDAVMARKSIEKVVSGRVHGTDVSAGFEKGWVELVDLNQQVAAPGTQEAVDAAIEQFKRGKGDFVFKGDYVGVNPDNPDDTYDLREGYVENATTSFPTFRYILQDVISVE